jgi:hypothetical protein
MATEKTEKNRLFFVCGNCDFSCSSKTDWDRHVVRPKHLKLVFGNDLATKKLTKPHACECGKCYADRTGLWKHEQKCVKTTEPDMTNLVLEVVKSNVELQKQNNEFKDLLIEQNKNIIDAIKNGIANCNHNTINSHNKTFNLQVFLNEDCKDAMNVTDFVNSIQFQLADLEYMGQVGYVDGISNIIIKNLKALDITKRPVHCTDPKRETIYIKDGGVWEKDDDNNKLRKMIKSVAFRNSKVTKLFKEKYPDCNQGDSKYSDVYNKIVIEAMGGGSKCNDYDSENKIMKKIAKVMTIDKNNLS